ncbi:MAG: hypothetical protein J6X18_09610 [Bacteroidales bacterium]|nr:hypothetical protein [Bacteroidales bacterium]
MNTILQQRIEEAAELFVSEHAPTYPDVSWDNCYEKMKDSFISGATYALSLQ